MALGVWLLSMQGPLFSLLQPQALLLIRPSVSLLSALRHGTLAFTGLCLDGCLTL